MPGIQGRGPLKLNLAQLRIAKNVIEHVIEFESQTAVSQTLRLAVAELELKHLEPLEVWKRLLLFNCLGRNGFKIPECVSGGQVT